MYIYTTISSLVFFYVMGLGRFSTSSQYKPAKTIMTSQRKPVSLFRTGSSNGLDRTGRQVGPARAQGARWRSLQLLLVASLLACGQGGRQLNLTPGIMMTIDLTRREEVAQQRQVYENSVPCVYKPDTPNKTLFTHHTLLSPRLDFHDRLLASVCIFLLLCRRPPTCWHIRACTILRTRHCKSTRWATRHSSAYSGDTRARLKKTRIVGTRDSSRLSS